jgi:hypothetical protein
MGGLRALPGSEPGRAPTSQAVPDPGRARANLGRKTEYDGRRTVGHAGFWQDTHLPYEAFAVSEKKIESAGRRLEDLLHAPDNHRDGAARLRQNVFECPSV